VLSFAKSVRNIVLKNHSRKKIMKKIIHLSDAHIGYQDLSTKMGDIVTRIIYTKEDASNYVIVHTGDVVEDATRAGSYEEALCHFNRLKAAGFTVLFVPGNHDYGTGILGSEQYVDKFKRYFYGNKNIVYPIKSIIDEIAFIGLDSMAEELNWYDRLWSEGELGEAQLNRLSVMLNTEEVKRCPFKVVYLHHHPFHPKPFHQLKDSDKLEKILKPHKISALLFGHNHDGRIWNGRWGISRAYDGGTSTAKEGKPNPHRVIDLSKDPIFDYDAHF
jgi:3',5'-cyclic AMP phosphodiesterase CpdA